jgi:hypothetical protein
MPDLNLYVNNYVVASGTDTYVATFSPAFPSYFAGMVIQVYFTNANTGASTVNVDGLGAKSIVKGGNTALGSGDIIAGTIYKLVYDGTNFQSDIGISGKIYDWVPVFTGYSVAPTVVRAKYRVIDNFLEFWLYLTFNSGTSNATTATFTGPVNALNAGEVGPLYRVVSAGVSQAAVGMWLTAAGSNVMTCYLTNNNASNVSWGNSVGKTFNAQGGYFI